MAQTRNTAVLREVAKVFRGFVPRSGKALGKLAERFKDDYPVVAGSVESVAQAADQYQQERMQRRPGSRRPARSATC